VAGCRVRPGMTEAMDALPDLPLVGEMSRSDRGGEPPAPTFAADTSAPHPDLPGQSRVSLPVLRTPAYGERGRPARCRLSLLPVRTGRRCRQADEGQASAASSRAVIPPSALPAFVAAIDSLDRLPGFAGRSSTPSRGESDPRHCAGRSSPLGGRGSDFGILGRRRKCQKSQVRGTCCASTPTPSLGISNT